MGIHEELAKLAAEPDEQTSESEVQEQDQDLVDQQVEEVTEPEQTPAEDVEQVADSVEAEPTSEEVTEEWVPNLKFKHLGEEKDFPEWSKDFVKSKELEENFRGLLAKAEGLDFSKSKREELETEFAEYKTQIEPKVQEAMNLANVVQNFNNQISTNDPREQLHALTNAGMTEKAILEVARHIFDVQKFTPEQRQAYQNQFETRDKMTQYESEVETLKQQVQQSQIESARNEISGFLASKSDFQKEYESRDGNEDGDFQKDFINYGVAMQQKLGRNIELKDAFKSFKKVHALGKKPVKPAARQVPNLKSTGHSPVEVAFKSLDDVRAYKEKIEGY